jgi:TatA/E family protein of Tat protein translocase
MFGLGMGEVILVMIIALVFIGPKKLPEIAKGLGKGLREFQNAAKGFQDQMTKEVDDLKPKLDEDLPKISDITEKPTGHGHYDPNPGEHVPDSIPPEAALPPEKKDKPPV